MANTNAPFGAMPLAGADGAAPTFGMTTRLIAYNDTTKIYRGDLVQYLASGYVGQWENGKVVSQAAGVFWGCKYYSVSQQQTTFSKYWPGADVATNAIVTAYLIPIATAVPPQFVIQAGSTAATFAMIGANCDVDMGTGSTTTGQSGMFLDTGNLATTATKPFRIIGLYADIAPGAKGTEAGAYNKVIVQANIYQETGINT